MTSHQHNDILAKKFGVPPPYPPVTQQLETLPLNRKQLKPHGYNPSIIRWNGRILMAYRFHPGYEWATRLAVAELDQSFKVIGHKELGLGDKASFEDPRLFIHQDALWMSWTESAGPTGNWHCVVKYGKLKEEEKLWTVPGQFQPKFGFNDGAALEKGWVFHPHGKALFFVYESSPSYVLCEVEGDVASEASREKSEHWPWGAKKGGCIVECADGKYLRFFHSTLDNENNPGAVNNHKRRYYIGCTKDGRQCRRPILAGSELCDLTGIEMTSINHYKSNVVFGSGAIAMDDGSFVLSVGINDAQCALIRVKESDLNL